MIRRLTTLAVGIALFFTGRILCADESTDRARAILIWGEPAPSTSAPDAPPPRASEAAGTTPAAQVHIQPPAATGVVWVTDAEAIRSPKPDWYHLSDDPRYCPHCRTADKLITDAAVVAASRKFDCVYLPHIRPKNAEREAWLDRIGIEGFPSDVVFSPDRKCWVVYSGVATDARGYVERLADGHEIQRAVEPTPKKPKPTTAWPDYPIRGGRYWTGCRSWQHLTQGEHRGKFNSAWLRSLSWGELQSLHSDDHESRVRWSYAVR